ncbi:MAG: hypothetical protein H0U71_01525 [Gammaproteobacteria bacterium]|nr:hypothetical protein [Gammaproteobacteria bacterium]
MTRIINKTKLSAVLLFGCVLFSLKCYADEAAACSVPGTCAPCGYISANAAGIPSYDPGINPLTNYVASAETIRCRGYFAGPYLGAAYGLGNINYHLKVGGVSPFGMDNDARSYLVTIFNGGYNFVFDYFFLGGEVGYNYRSRVNPISYLDPFDSLVTQGVGPVAESVSSFPCKIRLDINSQHAVSADLLPGFVFSRFVAYLRLGVEQTQYSWNRRVCFPLVTLDDVGPDLSTQVLGMDFAEFRKKTGTGYRLGAGFGVAAGLHVSFHLNYIHTFGNKMTFTPDVSAIAANLPIAVISEVFASTASLTQLAADNVIEPQRDEVNFGVKFRF